ncbi:hypothetical protein ACQ4PT_068869 [Festuca glaucescens]
MGQNQTQASPSVPWQAPNPAPWPAPWVGVMLDAGVPRTSRALVAVEKVAADVARLCVHENNNTGRVEDMEASGGDNQVVADMTRDINTGVIVDTTGGNIGTDAPEKTTALDINKGVVVPMANDQEDMETTDQGNVGAVLAHDINNGAAASMIGTAANGANKMGEKAETLNNNGHALLVNNNEQDGDKDVVASNGPLEEESEGADISASISTNMKNTKGWKRKKREQVVEQVVSKPATSEEHQMLGISMVRPRSEDDGTEKEMKHWAKRGPFQAPTLSECLGKEGLQKLCQAEQEREERQKDTNQGFMAGIIRGHSAGVICAMAEKLTSCADA